MKKKVYQRKRKPIRPLSAAIYSSKRKNIAFHAVFILPSGNTRERCNVCARTRLCLLSRAYIRELYVYIREASSLTPNRRRRKGPTTRESPRRVVVKAKVYYTEDDDDDATGFYTRVLGN